MSSSPCFLDPVVIPLLRGKTLLDVGCGYGRWASLVSTNYWETESGEPMEVDGFDAFLPNVALCLKKNVYRRVWQQQLPSALSGRWDTVLASEILEHLDEEHVPEVLETLEKAAKRRIIITTPNWAYFRGGGDTIVGYNEFEAHKTYIPRDYFLERDYTVVGAGFGNPTHPVVNAFRSMQGDWKNALELLPRLIPELAHTVVAFKDVDASSEDNATDPQPSEVQARK